MKPKVAFVFVGVCLVVLGQSLLAHADVVSISPTVISSDPAEQILNSMDTLNEFQDAVEGTPPEGRTIRLEEGVYDFSAVVILEPDLTTDPPPRYQRVAENVDVFNPYGYLLSYTGSGVAILGKQSIVIEGAVDRRGTLLTTIRGNTDPSTLDGFGSPLAWYNNVLHAMDGMDAPARGLTIRNIKFESTNCAISAVGGPLGLYGGVGTEDLRVEGNHFDMQGNFAVVVTGAHLRPTLYDNVFNGRSSILQVAIDIVGLPPIPEGEVRDLLIEGNTLNDIGLDGMRLFDRLAGAVVRHNTVTNPVQIGIWVLVGTHGVPPHFPPDSGGSVIEHNTVTGGLAGIGVMSFGWTIRQNSASSAVYGFWTEWPSLHWKDGKYLYTTSEFNTISQNSFRNNAIGIFIGAYSRNNRFQGNNVTGNESAGYLIGGAEYLPPFVFGRASGNVIIGANSQSGRLIDLSDCTPLPGGCPPVDYDGDGLVEEDPINGVDDDGDWFIDEAPAEFPNYYTGMQAEYGPVTPPSALTHDSDGDGLTDVDERRFSAQGWCLDPYDEDTDDDGVLDGVEFRTGTLDYCSLPFGG